MAISINTNMASIMAYKGLQSTSNALGKSMQRLASGLKINTARDDAAGLAIATRMQAQIRGLNAVQQNANDGASLSDVAYSALTETDNALQSIREIAVEARNATLSSSDRTALQLTVSELVSEVQRIATGTAFNKINLLTGSFANKSFQVGANAGDTVKFTINTASLEGLGMGAAGVNADVTTAALASTTITTIDTAISSVSAIRAQLSGMQSRFESVLSTAIATADAYTASRSSIMDADVALESANMTKYSILQQAGISVLAQANQQPSMLLKLLE
ncbi:Flagellar filament 33 kDa core protein [Candidatus Magnetaquicoccaceae bacterium FCR-1]|uniref:Flagellin n=1 Tax=Candidatus Magnetaquiglobus chichijimensis TaxID=3141448 RepID=A0ABQ0C8T6_9PROT